MDALQRGGDGEGEKREKRPKDALRENTDLLVFP